MQMFSMSSDWGGNPLQAQLWVDVKVRLRPVASPSAFEDFESTHPLVFDKMLMQRCFLNHLISEFLYGVGFSNRDALPHDTV